MTPGTAPLLFGANVGNILYGTVTDPIAGQCEGIGTPLLFGAKEN